ncbi:hypothetical protein P152DRAFT_495336 [Eremomyces bilateralis CBS 781.70]|uniref:Uncharacterized protein n=1 Tax=Eremomyces bilateralis CBS 781.70 TaxID=1392243 RepID=A0A6G1FT74_9PEZI|nr:uncharacterized protein P152DRAFT_495336 [Eremomyces bilateralis CBS 781.70]KAF1808936.1 hypothetical protein P152DRAFT_495336 [Eremomyces bilateralis CBS 781.70]
MSRSTDEPNYNIFRDIVSEFIIAQFTMRQVKKKATKRASRKSNGSVSIEAPREDKSTEDVGGPEGLTEFIDVRTQPLRKARQYIATEIFQSLPSALRSISYATYRDSDAVQETYPSSPPLPFPTIDALKSCIPPDVAETLSLYVSVTSELGDVTVPIVHDMIPNYISQATSAPPSHNTAPPPPRSPCEICERTQLPLTYHHLIPRGAHAKVVKCG